MSLNKLSPMSINRLYCILILAIFFFSIVVVESGYGSDDYPLPKYPIEKTVDESLVVVVWHKYILEEYAEIPVLEPIERSDATYETPELALRSMLSSVLEKDFKWFLETWDLEARSRYEETVRKRYQNLLSSLKGTITLTYRVNYQKMVIVGFEVHEDDNNVYEGNVTFLVKDGIWIATLRKVDDPIIQHFHELEAADEEYEIKRYITSDQNGGIN